MVDVVPLGPVLGGGLAAAGGAAWLLGRVRRRRADGRTARYRTGSATAIALRLTGMQGSEIATVLDSLHERDPQGPDGPDGKGAARQL